ncbi:MAG: argininosuccinate synthase [Chloroflexi bacterium]|jgi:argininosuccinate synthase|nr:MAG: argininosuccinate synthase [Chloroflexota bacterium]
MGKSEKILLAYSGGLDTSVILHWLISQGHDVATYTANLGQDDDMQDISSKAVQVGASNAYVEDLTSEFVTDFIFPAIRANAIYEGKYLLGTSLARPLTAKGQVEAALKAKSTALSHGATGKGNDQVRFEFTFHTLAPELKIYAPWRDPLFLSKFTGRPDMLHYAKKNNIPVSATKRKPWSSDANLMHISYEAGELEDPARRPRESMFQMTRSPKKAPNKETEIEIEFRNGDPIEARNLQDGHSESKPVQLFQYLNNLGGVNGIGREDMVENRFVGIKSRGVYETPGGTILQKAHRDLEGLTLDREVMHLRDSLIPRFSELVYYGLWFSPEMEMLRSLFDKSQEYVSGTVTLSLYKGNVTIKERRSPFTLYSEDLASMDRLGNFDATDSTGFIRINAHRLRNNSLRKQKENL